MKLGQLKELLEKLQQQVEWKIQDKGADCKVREKSNTYFCNGVYINSPDGFIDFDDLAEEYGEVEK